MTFNRLKFLGFLAACALIAGSALFFLFRPAPSLLFLITLDTTRADAIDYSLRDNSRTPNLARLAAEGVRYDNAFALIPITLPSHAAMFYGQSPHQLGVYTNDQVCDVPRPSLAEILKAEGYKTAAAISLGVLQRSVGIGKGFDHYLEKFRPGVWIKYAEAVNRDLKQLMDTHPPGNKSFYWIHYSDPHHPYYTPAYRGGEFSAYMHDRKLFSCDAVDQVRVQLDLELKPGANTLHLRAKMPKAIITNQNVMVIALYFLDFSPAPEALPEGIEMRLPRKWNPIRLRQKASGQRIGYNTWSRRARLVFHNRRSEQVNLRISFIYRTFEPPFTSRYLYHQEIQYMDQQIGELISYLEDRGWYDRATFLIMGDHGEGLGEHRNTVGHIHYLNGLYTRVPMILAGRDVTERGVRGEVVSNLNIAPTLLDLAGVEPPAYMKGDSLLSDPESRPLVLETYTPEAYHDGFALLDYPHQLIFYPEREESPLEFYDLSADPLGITPVGTTKRKSRIYADFRTKLVTLARSLMALKLGGREVSATQKEILKTLGYL